jgi:hypothetical protein
MTPKSAAAHAPRTAQETLLCNWLMTSTIPARCKTCRAKIRFDRRAYRAPCTADQSSAPDCESPITAATLRRSGSVSGSFISLTPAQ